MRACIRQAVTPFVFTLEEGQEATVYHPPLQSGVERKLISSLGLESNIQARPLDELPDDAAITHVNAISRHEAIQAVLQSVKDEPYLVAYSGTAWEGKQWRWLGRTPQRCHQGRRHPGNEGTAGHRARGVLRRQ